MMNNTKSKCTVPWIRNNEKICTTPEDVNTSFWISWNHGTNQHNDCHSPCHRLIIDLGNFSLFPYNLFLLSQNTLYNLSKKLSKTLKTLSKTLKTQSFLIFRSKSRYPWKFFTLSL